MPGIRASRSSLVNVTASQTRKVPIFHCCFYVTIALDPCKLSLIMMEENLLKTATKLQDIHFKLLDGTSYDLIERDYFDKFGEILSHYLHKKDAKELSAKIIHNKNTNLKYRILIVHCIVDGKLATFPVVRVLENSKSVFYDQWCRRYSDWNDFLCYNKLPGGLMFYPVNGSYTQRNGKLDLEKKKSPAAELPSKVDKYLYVTAEVVSVITLALPLFSFSKPYADLINVASGFSQGYKAVHHSYKLYDFYKHGQSIDFSDENASLHWSHIGNSFLSFAFTHLRLEYGNPCKENDANNIINVTSVLIKKCIEEENMGLIGVLKQKLLSEHMCFFMTDVRQLGGFELNLVLPALRNFLGEKGTTAFRKVVSVDDKALKTVLQDIRNCNDVHGIKNHWDELAEEIERIVVNKVEEEVESWKHEKISNNQLQFRISKICQCGNRTFETLEELFCPYSLDGLETFMVYNKPIFQNVGERRVELENLVQHASKKFPQLLSYAVEYCLENHPVDWEKFKPYFIKKLLQETSSLPITIRRPNISWINVRTFQEVTYSTSCSRICFIRPSNKSNPVCPQDLINLGKKLLGILNISCVDIVVANPDTKWTVMISKAKKRIICIGPENLRKDSGLEGSYPVFIRTF